MTDVRIPRPPLRDDFRKRLRADLMSEAVALAEERRTRASGIGARVLALLTGPRIRPVLAAATAFAILIGGTGVAAAGSLPGDVAFPLKRAAEEIELALAPDVTAKVAVLARQAERRLDELSRSASQAGKAPTASSEYEAAVERFTAAVAALRATEPAERRRAAEQVVEAARAKHTIVLEELKQRLPAEAQPGIERALEEHRRLAPGREKDEEQAPGLDPERSPGRPSEAPGRAKPSGAPGRP